MRLIQWLARRRFPYEPLISISISRSRLLGNLEALRKLAPGKAIAPVLKSNAYGHGLCETAEILERGGGPIAFFAVDSYFEAVALRARRSKTPIVIIGYTRPDTIANSYLPKTSFTIASMEALRDLLAIHRIPRPHTISIHLKIDTGMHRQGIKPEELPEALSLIHSNRFLSLDGAMTHFADADNTDRSSTERQIQTWNSLAQDIKASFPKIKHLHAANTDGSVYAEDIDCTAIRPGIGLYGLSENPRLEGKGFLPSLEMKTIITGVKKLRSGESIGYGGTFKANKDMTIATIPVGYFEGIDRRLSSGADGEPRGFVQIGTERLACPILGRVSMNISVIDISALPYTKLGAEAIVISRESADSNSIRGMARTCGTIPYEIAVHIPAQLKRTIVD